MRLSIILPCYNVAPYIGRCLDSLLAQDITSDEYEIICVDDCSSDNTVDIILKYQKNNDNIILLQHHVNKTAGGARNTGINNARGEHLWFVDPDDSVTPNCLSILIEKAESINSDLLFFNYYHIDEDGNTSSHIAFQQVNQPCSGQHFLLNNFDDRHLFGVTSTVHCIYRLGFLNSFNIRFPEIKASQDVVFIWKCLLCAPRVCSLPYILYNYHRRLDSTTGKKGQYRISSIISASLLYPNELKSFITSFQFIDKCFVQELSFAIRNALNDNSRKVLHLSKKGRKQFYITMKKNSSAIDALSTYMNRKTRVIFDYRIPFFIWDCILIAYSIKSKY